MATISNREERQPPFLRVLGWSRYLILVAVTGVLAGAIALLVYGAWETVHLFMGLARAAHEPNGAKRLILGSIEVTDVFLQGTALYVVGIGLFELFIDDRLDLPGWLQIHDLNDLKEKLVGVLIVVMAVPFLGQVVIWEGERNLLSYGAAIALVIGALTWFIRRKPDR
jgi:uncharacterized membrane protein YqhA